MISEIFEEAKVNKAELRELVVEEFKKDTIQLNPNENIKYSVNIWS